MSKLALRLCISTLFYERHDKAKAEKSWTINLKLDQSRKMCPLAWREGPSQGHPLFGEKAKIATMQLSIFYHSLYHCEHTLLVDTRCMRILTIVYDCTHTLVPRHFVPPPLPFQTHFSVTLAKDSRLSWECFATSSLESQNNRFALKVLVHHPPIFHTATPASMHWYTCLIWIHNLPAGQKGQTVEIRKQYHSQQTMQCLEKAQDVVWVKMS